MQSTCRRTLLFAGIIAFPMAAALFLLLRQTPDEAANLAQLDMVDRFEPLPGQPIYHANFMLKDGHRIGFVHEYETIPCTRICPIHNTVLRLQPVPIVGAFISPPLIAVMSSAYPFGRLAASAGSCESGGSVHVYRCADCVAAVQNHYGPEQVQLLLRLNRRRTL